MIAQRVLSSPFPRKGLVVVTCTNPPPYNVEIDQWAGTPVAATNRLMTGPASATVGSDLYQVTVSF
jgi:spore coat protein U-like protein